MLICYDASMNSSTIQTKRLSLRPWKHQDLEPFAQMNADPKVMEYFPSTLSLAESEKSMKNAARHFEEYGFGFWVATLRDSQEFIGFIGLKHVDFTAHFTPAIEIGWRLAFQYWGQGYATEGALAALQYGFNTLHLKEIVSFTAKQNIRSQKVMQRIGMHHDSKDDFDHPKLPEGHRLRRHVLYRIKQNEELDFIL